jgi:hypothetical protein
MDARERAAGISPELSAGYDLLTGNGLAPELAARLLVSAEDRGQNPESFARHLLRLRRAAQADCRAADTSAEG